MVAPSSRREVVRHLRDERGIAERRGCQLVGVARSTVRYRRRPRPLDESSLVERIQELAKRRRRYGYRQITRMLRREGTLVNHKRVYRLWRRERLQVPRKGPRRRHRGPTVETREEAQRPNHVWSYDFCEDRTTAGKKLRLLVILDEFTRECLAIEVGFSLPASRVLETLEWLLLCRGAPAYIRSDNGPEFRSGAGLEWLRSQGCGTMFIEPGKPWQNGYVERFIGTLRDDCLNQELFASVGECQRVVDAWREDYNRERPHSSLDGLTPSEFAARWAPPLRATPSTPSPTEKEEPILTL